ncbi:MAG: bifunctional glutamate N-acetyltransferase/amino-acid acetyltransferase ArgJ [Chloroflexi bacterium]|nr:bifunctional glutamate N-acetyltransferase/amino-acid acetyltransferase ArgJ [Chloroflexota bacterium]
MSFAVDPAGTATSPLGFSAGATFAGIKTYGEGKLDLAILASDRDCAVAATFTRNRLRSAAIEVNVARLKQGSGRGRGVVVNAGVANSSTGQRGVEDGERMCELAAPVVGAEPVAVFVGSTGVIGHFLPMDKLEAGIKRIQLSRDGGLDFARAIMTTDTRTKHGAVRFGPYTLGGCCKGSGMIHPNMATMLAYLTTDAPVEGTFLAGTLSQAVERSFNLVSVDGDTSPSDTTMLFANGAAGGEPLDAKSPLAGEFAAAVEALCVYLAKEVARDGEGATKLMEVTVRGAASVAEARQLVREMTTSYLLKSAVHGADPNWGRIVAVIGRSKVAINEPLVSVSVCGYRVFEAEQPTEHNPADVAAAMGGKTVTIEVDLGAGAGEATGWGCDLTAEYVSINADYHT